MFVWGIPGYMKLQRNKGGFITSKNKTFKRKNFIKFPCLTFYYIQTIKKYFKMRKTTIQFRCFLFQVLWINATKRNEHLQPFVFWATADYCPKVLRWTEKIHTHHIFMFHGTHCFCFKTNKQTVFCLPVSRSKHGHSMLACWLWSCATGADSTIIYYLLFVHSFNLLLVFSALYCWNRSDSLKVKLTKVSIQ